MNSPLLAPPRHTHSLFIPFLIDFPNIFQVASGNPSETLFSFLCQMLPVQDLLTLLSSWDGVPGSACLVPYCSIHFYLNTLSQQSSWSLRRVLPGPLIKSSPLSTSAITSMCFYSLQGSFIVCYQTLNSEAVF